MINDRGSWLVACRACHKKFVIDLRNPEESPVGDCLVIERFDDDIAPYDGDAPRPGARAFYQLDLNQDRLRFDYGATSLYRCADTDEDLEAPALEALKASYPAIVGQIAIASHHLMRGPAVEHVVVKVGVACRCDGRHEALFYMPLRLDLEALPEAESFLLADVSGADISDRLTGIRSKTAIMDSLEKLIARWRLFCDQVLISTPFIAGQYKTKAERLEIWERLLGQLDPNRTLLLTRGKTFSEYRAALDASGLDSAILKRFGLENQIVSSGRKKQDFHSKIYAGIGDCSEMLSGSANVLRGPSQENVSFHAFSRAQIQRKYLDPLQVVLPTPQRRCRHHLMIAEHNGTWRAELAAGPAPDRSGV